MPYPEPSRAAKHSLRSGSTPADSTPLAVAGLPDYEMIELIGEGGMGLVYKARQIKLNRIVALKLLGANRAGPKEFIRFLALSEAVAAIEHPHVVPVYEYGDADGRPFLAMEYVPNGSLSDRLKKIAVR